MHRKQSPPMAISIVCVSNPLLTRAVNLHHSSAYSILPSIFNPPQKIFSAHSHKVPDQPKSSRSAASSVHVVATTRSMQTKSSITRRRPCPRQPYREAFKTSPHRIPTLLCVLSESLVLEAERCSLSAITHTTNLDHRDVLSNTFHTPDRHRRRPQCRAVLCQIAGREGSRNPRSTASKMSANARPSTLGLQSRKSAKTMHDQSLPKYVPCSSLFSSTFKLFSGVLVPRYPDLDSNVRAGCAKAYGS